MASSSSNSAVILGLTEGTLGFSDDDYAEECPLCMDSLDIDDRGFFPCSCGYQVCRFCWNRLKTDTNKCPGCRSEYGDQPAEFRPLTQEDINRIKAVKRQREADKRQKEIDARRALANVRVVQRNLVYVVGLSPRLSSSEALLRSQDYFGNFGNIAKVVINRTPLYHGASGPSCSAYVTYSSREEAAACIQGVDGMMVDGRVLKASLGTTKYCTHYLRNSKCLNTDCMYLHESGDASASFTKEDMAAGKHQAWLEAEGEKMGIGTLPVQSLEAIAAERPQHVPGVNAIQKNRGLNNRSSGSVRPQQSGQSFSGQQQQQQQQQQQMGPVGPTVQEQMAARRKSVDGVFGVGPVITSTSGSSGGRTPPQVSVGHHRFQSSHIGRPNDVNSERSGTSQLASWQTPRGDNDVMGNSSSEWPTLPEDAPPLLPPRSTQDDVNIKRSASVPTANGAWAKGAPSVSSQQSTPIYDLNKQLEQNSSETSAKLRNQNINGESVDPDQRRSQWPSRNQNATEGAARLMHQKSVATTTGLPPGIDMSYMGLGSFGGLGGIGIDQPSLDPAMSATFAGLTKPDMLALSQASTAQAQAHLSQLERIANVNASDSRDSLNSATECNDLSSPYRFSNLERSRFAFTGADEDSKASPIAKESSEGSDQASLRALFPGANISFGSGGSVTSKTSLPVGAATLGSGYVGDIGDPAILSTAAHELPGLLHSELDLNDDIKSDAWNSSRFSGSTAGLNNPFTMPGSLLPFNGGGGGEGDVSNRGGLLGGSDWAMSTSLAWPKESLTPEAVHEKGSYCFEEEATQNDSKKAQQKFHFPLDAESTCGKDSSQGIQQHVQPSSRLPTATAADLQLQHELIQMQCQSQLNQLYSQTLMGTINETTSGMMEPMNPFCGATPGTSQAILEFQVESARREVEALELKLQAIMQQKNAPRPEIRDKLKDGRI